MTSQPRQPRPMRLGVVLSTLALLRSERLSEGLPDDVNVWRALYRSTDAHGAPNVVSGMVLVPDGRPEAPRPLVSVIHGTTGFVQRCAPSLPEAALSSIQFRPEVEPLDPVPLRRAGPGQRLLISHAPSPTVGDDATHPSTR